MLVFNWNHVCSGKRRWRWLVSRAAEGWAPAPASPGRGGAPAVPHPRPLSPRPRGLGAGLVAASGSCRSLPLWDPASHSRWSSAGTGRSRTPQSRLRSAGEPPGERAGWESIAAALLQPQLWRPFGEYPNVVPGCHAGLRDLRLQLLLPGQLLRRTPCTPLDLAPQDG